jgi:putative transposase
VAELLRSHSISRETFYGGKREFGGMGVSEAQRLKQLEAANSRLKRIVADQALNLQVLKDVMGRPW